MRDRTGQGGPSQPEPSVAWFGGDPGCEAYTGSPASRVIEPRIVVNECLAQLGERRPYKPWVAGSIPATQRIVDRALAHTLVAAEDVLARSKAGNPEEMELWDALAKHSEPMSPKVEHREFDEQGHA